MFALLIASTLLVAASPTPHQAAVGAKATLHLRGAPWVGERWIQGNEEIAVRGVRNGMATLDVKDLASGDESGIVVAVDPYSGAGPAIFFDQTTLCVTSGIASLCSPVTGAQTFSGAVTFSAAGTAVTVTNNASIGGTLQVTGTSTLGTVNAGQVSSSTLTASNCVGSDASKNLVSNTNCLQSLTAGTNVTSTGGANPTVAVTSAPSFSGSVSAVGMTNSGSASLTQSVSANTNNTAFPPFTSFTTASASFTQNMVNTATLSSGTDAGNGIVVGAVLNLSDTTNSERVTVTATPLSNTFQFVPANNHGTAVYTWTPALLPVTVTPNSMTGIAVGEMLNVDSGANLDQVPVTATNCPSPCTTFTAYFQKTHATSPSSIGITTGAFTSCGSTAAGCTFYSANATGGAGGFLFNAYSLPGTDGNLQAIMTIIVPSLGNSQPGSAGGNIPYDMLFTGGQNGDLGKTSHTLTFNCNQQPQDCVMFLLQGDTSGGTNQKCFTWNTGGGGSTSTPSIMVLKCRGDLSIINGDFTANSSSNGQGGIALGGSTTVTGALGNGAIDMEGKGIFATNGLCTGSSSNASPSLITLGSLGCGVVAQITPGSNTAKEFDITLPNGYNTNGACFVQLVQLGTNSLSTCSFFSSTVVKVIFASAPTTSGVFNVFFVGGM